MAFCRGASVCELTLFSPDSCGEFSADIFSPCDASNFGYRAVLATNTPISTAFCGGANKYNNLFQHGRTLAFCCGASSTLRCKNFQSKSFHTGFLSIHIAPEFDACGGTQLNRNSVQHGYFLAFCRGAPSPYNIFILWLQLPGDLDLHSGLYYCTFFRSGHSATPCTPDCAAFCGGAQVIWSDEQHGYCLAFCRGALFTIPILHNHFASESLDITISGHCYLISRSGLNFCKLITPEVAAFCGGAYFSYRSLQHGNSLAFCRGASNLTVNPVLQISNFSSDTLLQDNEFSPYQTACSEIVEANFTPELAAFCGGAQASGYFTILHGWLLAFCRGASTLFFLQDSCNGIHGDPALKDCFLSCGTVSSSSQWNLLTCEGAQIDIFWTNFSLALTSLAAFWWHLLALLALVLPLFHLISDQFRQHRHISLIQPYFLSPWSQYSFLHRSLHFSDLWALRRAGNPGPNSGHSRFLRRQHWLCALLLLQYVMTMESWSGGEGRVFSTEDTGAPSWETALIHKSGVKPCGPQPTRCFGNTWSSLDSVKKRSFKRAYRRIQRDGSCWYKGRCYTAQTFPFQLVLTLTQRKPPLLQDALLLFMIKLTATRDTRTTSFYATLAGMEAA